MKMYTLPTIFSFLLIFTSGLFAQNVSVLVPAKDNSMFSESGIRAVGNGNLFTGQTCQGNNRRALIEFDLSVIPSDAVITEVTLNLGTETSGDNGDGIIDILAVTREWGEGLSFGGGMGGNAVAPDATWTDAMFGTSFWDTDGGDFDPAILSSRFTSENFLTVSFPSSANFVARAQDWLDDASTNHGILIRGVEDLTCAAYRFGSRENGVSPELVVTWEAACNSPVTNIIVEECESFTSPNGTIFTTTGQFSEIIPGPNGCDTILNIDLTILGLFVILVDNTICDDDTFTLDGNVFDINNPSGTVIFPSTTGCDTIFMVDLTFAPATTSSIIEDICAGSNTSFVVGGTVFDESNPTGVEELVSVFGCDSIVTIELTILSAFEVLVNNTICDGDNFTLDGVVFDQNNSSGTVIFPSTTGGCDSIYTIDLTFFPASMIGEETFVGCEGDGFSIIVGGTVYDESNPFGTEILQGVDQNGCDSIVNINLVFNTVSQSEITNIGCEGDGFSIVVDGTIYDETNPNGSVFLISSNGCDSIVNIDLVFGATVTSAEDFLTCDPSTPPTITEVISGGAANGCDSIIIFTTIYLSTDETDIMAASCNPDEVGVEVIVLTNTSGCDSTVMITTILLSSDETELFATSCDPDDAGTETIVLINLSGCDSTVTTTTTILASDSTNVFTISCNQVDSGTVVLNLVNENGCDSIVTIFTDFDAINNMVSVTDATIIASFPVPGASYQWIDCNDNNAPIVDEIGQSFTATVSGNYAVEIMQSGCTITSECSMITVVGTEEIWFSDQLSVSPNPTRGDLRLMFGELENVNVRILDLRGRILLEKNNLGGGSEDLRMEGPAGVYFLGVEVDGLWSWMRVVKE